MMKFGSLFSGIGGFDLGFEQAGMECAWQCEIDKHAQAVLARHWPGVPCYEDVRDVRRDNVAAVDLVCGGFPCQDVSVAGKRAGLAGERSGLWFEFCRVIEELRPKWVVIENVPGLLSSNGGADFATILAGLVECGYGVSWRILDAQYFGVAQRRRRVFIVGSLGDGRSAEVLFEREGMFGHPPARRTQGEGLAADVAPSLAASGRGTERARESRGQDPVIAAFGGNNTKGEIDIATAVNAAPTRRYDFESETFVFEPRYTRNGRGAPDTIAPPLKAQNGGTGKGDGAPVVIASVAPTLSKESYSPSKSSSGQQVDWAIGTHSGVRRLTPTECERLQGFPDGWTAGQSDSARYRQLGNAVAVPVARWIGQRIFQMITHS